MVKSKNFIIPLIVYPFDVMCSFGESDDQLKKVLETKNVQWSANMKVVGQGLFYMTQQNQSIIRLNYIPKSCEEYGFLQHEIFHCVTMVLHKMGMKFIPLKSDEAYAYLIQYLTTKIYEQL